MAATFFSIDVLEFLRTQVRYEPETGHFYWLRKGNNAAGKFLPGDRAGGVPQPNGYVRISTQGICVKAHVLAYWFQTGEGVPAGRYIDHIDRNRSNNIWTNLRVVEQSLNNHNANPSVANTSGVRGVHKSRDNWGARLTSHRKTFLLGCFSSFEDAVQARLHAEIKYLGEITSRHVAHLYDANNIPKPRMWAYPSTLDRRQAAAELEKYNAAD